MGDRLKGKVAVVTGSGRGIGRAEAMLLASEGASVVVNDIGTNLKGSGKNNLPADELVNEIKIKGGSAVTNYDSIATSQGADNLIKTAVDSFGRLDILVNNAGFVRDALIYDMTDDAWDAVIKVHLYGAFYCSRAACRIFKEQQSGRIINTGSRAAFTGSDVEPNYCAAKSGVFGLTRNIAVVMKKFGVTCNCICPIAATRMTLNPETESLWERKGILQRRLKEMEKSAPERVAPLVVYLATEQAANINGRVFFIGGEIVQLYPAPAPVATIYREGGWTVDALDNAVPSLIGEFVA